MTTRRGLFGLAAGAAALATGLRAQYPVFVVKDGACRFPMPDAKHARAAVSHAARAYAQGKITEAEYWQVARRATFVITRDTGAVHVVVPSPSRLRA